MLVMQGFANFAGRNFAGYCDDARFFCVAGKEKAEAKAKAKGKKRGKRNECFHNDRIQNYFTKIQKHC